MRVKNYFKVLSVLGLLLAPNAVQANDFNFDSNIGILRVLNVTETQKMDFGVIEEPAGDVLVEITTEGTVGPSNTATHIDTSTIAEGRYKVFGSSLSTISISARNGTSPSGMTFQKLNAIYQESTADLINTGLTGLSAPTDLGTDLIVGAILNVPDAVTEGTYAPEFILEVNYE